MSLYWTNLKKTNEKEKRKETKTKNKGGENETMLKKLKKSKE